MIIVQSLVVHTDNTMILDNQDAEILQVYLIVLS